ncbi:MAG: helix-turn-helix domain-containing protein [Pseudoxanthomonas sp.]
MSTCVHTPGQVLSAADCPSRLLLDQIADKWSVLILAALCHQPLRFNVLKRTLEGVTQKALTQTLRRLERNGIVERRVVTTSPIAVEYRITPLGHTLKQPFETLYTWTRDYLPEVEKARQAFDAREQVQDLPMPATALQRTG